MSENIKKCEDGSYRWVYEFDMLKNPIIILTVLKIFVLVLVGIWVFVLAYVAFAQIESTEAEQFLLQYRVF